MFFDKKMKYIYFSKYTIIDKERKYINDIWVG